MIPCELRSSQHYTLLLYVVVSDYKMSVAVRGDVAQYDTATRWERTRLAPRSLHSLTADVYRPHRIGIQKESERTIHNTPRHTCALFMAKLDSPPLKLSQGDFPVSLAHSQVKTSGCMHGCMYGIRRNHRNDRNGNDAGGGIRFRDRRRGEMNNPIMLKMQKWLFRIHTAGRKRVREEICRSRICVREKYHETSNL